MKEYTGKEYLQIDIASQFGLDKKLFEDRIQWVNENENRLEQLEYDADDFFRYAAAVKAYRRAQRGEAIGHLVGLDACASGPAILSTWLGCHTGALNTGVIGQDRADVYGKCTMDMEETLEGNMGEYSRSDVKYAFMPHFYLSKAEPKKVFGDGTPEHMAFLKSCWNVCPGASMYLQIVEPLWNPNVLSYRYDYPDDFVVHKLVTDAQEDKIEVDTLPGHPVFNYIHTVNTTLEDGKFLAADIVQGGDGFMVREITARCNYKPHQMKGAELHLIERLKKDINVEEGQYLYCEQMWRKHQLMSLVGAEFVNEWSVNQMSKEYCISLLALVRRVMKKPPFTVVTVHDEYKCLPNYMNYLRWEYIQLLAEMADSTMLEAILSDVAGRTMHIEKLSDNLAEEILKSEYPLA